MPLNSVRLFLDAIRDFASLGLPIQLFGFISSDFLSFIGHGGEQVRMSFGISCMSARWLHHMHCLWTM